MASVANAKLCRSTANSRYLYHQKYFNFRVTSTHRIGMLRLIELFKKERIINLLSTYIS